MALRIRFQFTQGYSLGYSIERLADGLLYDFATSGATAGTFTSSPATPIAALTADTGNFAGRYKTTLTSTPSSQFLDGDYCITIHNTAAGNAVVGELAAVMRNGDDASTSSGGSGSDPWSQALPGAYAPGTAGYLVGTNLDTKVSSRLAASAYTAPPTDYQQRGQPVVLPTTAPSWYSTSGAPTLAQIVSGVWDEPRSAHVAAGSFGAQIDAPVSSRLASGADSPGTTTLLARLTSDRAAYLDALNISGVVASHADAVAIQNNTLVRIFTPDVIQRPASGSIARIIHLYTYDEQGNMATPDAAPTLAVTSGGGSSRNANLDSTTMALVAPGHYKAVYTLLASDPIEQLVWSFTVVRGGQTRVFGGTTEVIDVASVAFNANDRANLNQILQLAGTTGVVVAASSKGGYALTSQEHAAIVNDAVAALNSAIPGSPTANSVYARLDAPISSRSTYAGGPVASVVAPVTVGQNNDKGGYALSASGLDAVTVEPGINARQALSPILAATAGVVTGAGTGTITIQAGNSTTARIMAATDNLGNRSSVVLTLPA